MKGSSLLSMLYFDIFVIDSIDDCCHSSISY